MWLSALVATLAALDAARAHSRDIKLPKTLPGISNSLVNLGKMDIAFYLTDKDAQAIIPRAISDDNVIDEDCHCSNFKSPLSSNSDLVNKIMSSNQLFKAPFSSSFCCGDSHEHVEDTVILELGSKFPPARAAPAAPAPYYSSALYPLGYDPQASSKYNFPGLSTYLNTFGNLLNPGTVSGTKNKAIEIFFFPKKKDSLKFDIGASGKAPKKFNGNSNSKTKHIQVVGDREFKNDFSMMAFQAPQSITVKKDLATQEKKSKDDAQKAVQQVASTTELAGADVATGPPTPPSGNTEAPLILIESKPNKKPNSLK